MFKKIFYTFILFLFLYISLLIAYCLFRMIDFFYTGDFIFERMIFYKIFLNSLLATFLIVLTAKIGRIFGLK